MSTYTVKKAEVTKTEVGKYNNNEITATLENGDGKEAEVTFLQKPESPLPEVGSQLTGTVEQTQYGLKFKREWKQSGGGYGGGNRDEEINRAVAVKAATQLAAAQISAGVVKEDAQAIAALSSFTEQIFAVLTKSADKPEGKAQTVKSDDDIPF